MKYLFIVISTIILSNLSLFGTNFNKFSSLDSNFFSNTYNYKHSKYLQTILNYEMKDLNLDIDGYVGIDTINGIRKLQNRYNLKIDGIIGTNTKKVLDNILKKFNFHYNSITKIDPKIILRKNKKQIIKIYGNYFTKDTKVYWLSSSKQSGIISKINFISKNQINLYINLGTNANYWKFAIINNKKKSILKKIYFENYGVSKKDNFLHLPIKGKHKNTYISSLYDHNDKNNIIKVFNGLIAKKKFGIRNSKNSSCYKTKNSNNIKIENIRYKGVFNQKNYLCYDQHKGIDYAVPLNTKVYASATGVIVSKKYSSKAGYFLVINHGNGFASAYMHLKKQNRLNIGTHVTKNTLIAYSGNSGNVSAHLHFEIRANYTKNIKELDYNYKKVDPYGFKGKNILWKDWLYKK